MNRRYVALTIAYCAGLFYLSSGASPVKPPSLFAHEDKVIHAMLYAGLAAVVWIGMRRAKNPAGPRMLFLAPILFACAYGISDEFHQWFVPGRTADVWDAASDTCGALIMQILIAGCVHVRGRQAQPSRRSE